MLPKNIGIQGLVLRTFLPAVLIVAMSLAVLVYNLQYAVILDGFDRKLITTSAVAGAMIDPTDHDWLMQQAQAGADPERVESTEAYRRNVEPMQRIRAKLGLTYLYTQALGGGGDIYYILDSSFGDDHSTIGSEDDLPAETVTGLRNAEAQGTVYISPIEYQKQWGLLKTAAAPVYGVDGRITATAGADVNISVIHVATQNALFASAMIGLLSILLCLFATLQIMRRIAHPIGALKLEALRIAAGDHAPPAEIHKPREAGALRNALASVARHMVSTSALKRHTADKRRRDADERHLTSALGEKAPVVKLHDNQDTLIFWIPKNEHSAEHAMAARGMALLRDRIAQDPSLLTYWESLADLEHGAFLYLDRRVGTLSALGAPVRLRIDGEDADIANGEEKEILSASSVSLLLGADETVIFAKEMT